MTTSAALPPATPFRAACIDVGSNGIRCAAVECVGAVHRSILQERAPVRLGQGVFLDGSIDAAAMDAAVAALKQFRMQLDKLAPLTVRAVATSAVRDARNRKRFLRRARDEAGVEVETISGQEEARLVHVAVAKRIPMDAKPWVLVDVGGGSVEVSLGNAEGLQWTESRGMGAVRLLEQFREVEGNARKVRRLIEETVGTLRLPGIKGGEVAGMAATGGNIEELARLCGAREGKDKVQVLPAKALRDLLDAMLETDLEERARRWDLKRDRADVILPAGLVYAHVARLAGAADIHVPNVALKDGVIAELVAQADPAVAAAGPAPEGKARRSALGLGRRFQFEESHGVHVEHLALSLFDQLADLHRLGPRDRTILASAALLHDVGRHVSDKRHHKHTYYLVSEAELLGLTQPEVELAALVARYHRKAEPKPKHKGYAALTSPDRERVERLSAILRVADALDRQHRGHVREVRCVHANGTTRLELQVQGDVQLEQWAVEKKGGLFERLFDTKIQVVGVGGEA
ncbi:MAG TPA: Ppx/GppA phosphatase family protein [Candidatus Thermoplasmatota archaeon]|nr:Ppx/GppA phosphatase family protein [Candidatus Thermoplasmatota archaeon]